jgi:glycerol-3-phosphate dehydrogenase
LLGRSQIIDHASDGVSDVVSIVGVKYTTARRAAQRAVDLVLRKLGRSAAGCRTADTILPTAGPQDTKPADPVRHAVEAEMAQTLADVVVRRTGIGAAGYPGDALVAEYARVMQRISGWSDQKVAVEIESLKHFYDIT